MTYAETLDYLFNALPMFQRVGASAYKADLTNTLSLCEHLGKIYLFHSLLYREQGRRGSVKSRVRVT